MNIPIAHSMDSLERFFEHIQESPTPDQVTVSYLKSNNFKTGNDPELRHIFRLLGFLDDNDKPKKRWDLYKNEGKIVLRIAVEESYKELFKAIPDAVTRSDVDLGTWFVPPVTGNSPTSKIRAIRTFRKLCMLAGMTIDKDMGEKQDPIPELHPHTHHTPSAQNRSSEPQLIIQVPPLSDQADYERMFEALKKVFFNEY